MLVVGAGPVGLAVATQATLSGATVRIVERCPGPRPWAPALAVQPGTLETLDRLGVADELLQRSVDHVDLRVHVAGATLRGRMHDLDLPDTRYRRIVFAPQPVVENVLRRRLAGLGVEVEWGTELVGLAQGESSVAVNVRGADGRRQTLSAQYLVGCDGRDSTVRPAAAIRFPGGTHRQTIAVGDVRLSPGVEPGAAHAFIGGGGILFLFPLPSGAWRLIAPHRGNREPDVATLVGAATGGSARVSEIEHLESFTPVHRLADRYRAGRVFIAGDAAHAHSPAAAQGMNVGIQDAVDLGWKLGFAASGAPDALLDTYERERRPVARRVIRLTRLAYALEVSENRLLSLGRRLVARPVAALLLGRPRLLSRVARVVSGLDVRYRTGAVDRARVRWGGIHPGRRLPYLGSADGPGDHFPIDAAAFHLLVFDDSVPLATVADLEDRHSAVLTVHGVDRPVARGRKGRKWPQVVLVRPDGYVAVVGDAADIGAVDRYLARWVSPDRPAGTAWPRSAEVA
ncbi:MAG TPA: FAD-dependent monooxygenase [Acidimicrobiia bacterium]